MSALHFVFDELPGQSGPHGPRLVEVETPDGKSVCAGQWRKRDDGLTELVIDTDEWANRHIHVGPGDECKKCGRDLRNRVHLRIGE